MNPIMPVLVGEATDRILAPKKRTVCSMRSLGPEDGPPHRSTWLFNRESARPPRRVQ